MNKFDIVYLYEFRSWLGIIVMGISLIMKKKYILQACGSLTYIYPFTTLKKIYDILFGDLILKMAFKVVAQTSTEILQYRELGVLLDKIYKIPNSIDFANYKNLPEKGGFKKQLSIDNDTKIILYLGRLDHIKGIDYLIEAFKYLRYNNNFTNTKLIIVGPECDYLNVLKEMSESFLNNEVLFPGPLYGEDKIKAYVDSEVVVVPSRYDTFPAVILEAFASGKPVIASNIGSLSDIILHGETGYLFSAGKKEELASLLIEIIENPYKAISMGQKARALAQKKYTLAKIAILYEALFKIVLSTI